MNQPSSESTVYAVYQNEALYLFSDLESAELASVSCIKGTALSAGPDDWREGLVFYIPTDQVTRIIEYASLEHFKHVITKYHHTKAAKV